MLSISLIKLAINTSIRRVCVEYDVDRDELINAIREYRIRENKKFLRRVTRLIGPPAKKIKLVQEPIIDEIVDSIPIVESIPESMPNLEPIPSTMVEAPRPSIEYAEILSPEMLRKLRRDESAVYRIALQSVGAHTPASLYNTINDWAKNEVVRLYHIAHHSQHVRH